VIVLFVAPFLTWTINPSDNQLQLQPYQINDPFLFGDKEFHGFNIRFERDASKSSGSQKISTDAGEKNIDSEVFSYLKGNTIDNNNLVLKF
jgi:hypothetical protein